MSPRTHRKVTICCENCGKPATLYRTLDSGGEAPTCDSCIPANWTGDARSLVMTLPDLGGRVALSKQEAAAALGVSVDYLDKRVMADLRVIHLGARVLIPVDALADWANAAAARALRD